MDTAFQNIRQKLNTFIKKYYTNELIKGLILFVSFGLLYFIFILFIEYFLWLSPFGRTILFWLFVSVEVFLLIRFIGFPIFKLIGLQKGISQKQAAKIIGNHFPEVDDKLLNVLQLHAENKQTELLLASIEQKATALKPIPFSFAVNFSTNYKYLKYSLLPIVLLLFIFFSGKANQFKKSYKRVTHFTEQFEKEAPFHFTVLSNLNAIENEKKIVKIEVNGEYIPEQITINYNKQTYFLKHTKGNIFEYEFPSIKKNTSFYLNANSFNSASYTIQVLAAPSIQKLQLYLDFPKYIHQKNKTITHTGNAIIPEGTIITWQVNTKNTDAVLFQTKQEHIPFKKNKSSYKLHKRILNNLDYTISSSNKDLKDYEQLAYQLEVIKDKAPTIQIQQAKDSIDNSTFYYLGKATDDYGLARLQLVYYTTDKPNASQKQAIKITRSTFSQFVFTFPGNLVLEEGKNYQYYFQIFDNDVVNGSKSTKSKVFNYYKQTNKEKEAQQLQEQKQDIKALENSAKEARKQQEQLKQMNSDFKQQKEMTWKDKKRLEEFIKRQEQYDQMLKQKTKEFEKKLDQFKDKKQDAFKEALKERIKDLSEEEIKKREKLLDELKKLSEKIKKEDLVKKLDELSKKNKQNERSLEQILELTKRYYVQEKMNQLADKLDELAKKQDTLAKEEKQDKAAQDELKKEFDKVKEALEDLEKQNQDLKSPIKTPETKKDSEDVDKEMQKASDEMKEKTDTSEGDSEQQKSESAKSSQSKAAKKMKQMSQKMKAASMKSAGGASGEEMNPEDIETLRQILENLVTFSLDQEALMLQFSEINYKHASFAKYLKEQHKLQNYFQYIDDSLFTLALRQPKISKKITDKLEDVHYNMEKSLETLAENQMNQASIHHQYTVTYANDLAYLLSRMLDAAQNPPPPMMGSGSCKKPGGFSLPDIIKKQGELTKKMEEGMKKKGEGKKEGEGEKQGGESGEKEGKGKQSKAGKNGKEKGGKDPSDSDEMDGEMYKIYQEQQELKNQLKELMQQNGIQNKGLLKKMDELEKELLYKGFSNGVLQKMQQLQHELLKLKNASFTQGQENERKSETNKKTYNKPTIPAIKDILKYFQQNEILNRKPLPLQPDYQEKTNNYFKTN
jgi:hypothetical protein